MEFQNNHEENYKQYLKQFHESQNDVISNQRRYDLGLSNQAITTGKMSVHKLQGGAMSSTDVYDYGQKLLKQRSDDLDNMIGFSTVTSSKGELIREAKEAVATTGLPLSKLVQKFALQISSWDISSKLFNNVLDMISFLQQDGYKLTENDIVESIDNLEDVKQLFVDESARRDTSDISEQFITEALSYIIGKIILFLKELLKHVNKSAKDRKIIQTSINKSINFSSFISEVNSYLKSLHSGKPMKSDKKGKSSGSVFSHSSFWRKPFIRDLFEKVSKRKPSSLPFVAEDDEDDGEAGEGEMGTTAATVGVVESKEMEPETGMFRIMDIDGNPNDFPIDVEEFMKKYVTPSRTKDIRTVNSMIKQFNLRLKPLPGNTKYESTINDKFKDLHEALFELSR